MAKARLVGVVYLLKGMTSWDSVPYVMTPTRVSSGENPTETFLTKSSIFLKFPFPRTSTLLEPSITNPRSEGHFRWVEKRAASKHAECRQLFLRKAIYSLVKRS